MVNNSLQDLTENVSHLIEEIIKLRKITKHLENNNQILSSKIDLYLKELEDIKKYYNNDNSKNK